MDWVDVRKRALWTAAESFLGVAVVFLGALAGAWVEAGAFVLPFALVVALAAGAVGAIAAGATVVKEYAKYHKEQKAAA